MILNYLDIEPDAVSIMGLINDKEHTVRLLVDEPEGEYLGGHPCYMYIQSEDENGGGHRDLQKLPNYIQEALKYGRNAAWPLFCALKALIFQKIQRQHPPLSCPHTPRYALMMSES